MILIYEQIFIMGIHGHYNNSATLTNPCLLSLFCRLSEEVLQEGMTVELNNDGGNAVLPRGFCPSNYQHLKGCNRSFSVSAVEWPNITHVGLVVDTFHSYFIHYLMAYNYIICFL